MTEKYNEIVSIVHPLYDVFYTDEFPKRYFVNGKNPRVDSLLKNTTESKKLKSQIKKTLGIYGAYLDSLASKKNTCVVVYLPSDHFETDVYNNKELKEFKRTFEVYLKHINPFLEHFKNKFKDRFFVTNYNGDHKDSTGAFLSKDVLKHLDKNVKLISLGEYYNPSTRKNKGCVYEWNNFLIKELANHNIVVKDINILKERTLAFNGNKILEGFRKAVLSKHEKRVVQSKNKKRKLKMFKPR